MACCGRSSGGCSCAVAAATDDGCSAVRATVSGAGSSGSPFSIGTTADWTRLFRLDGNEPWTLAVVGGCTMVVPRCTYEAI